MSSSLFQRSQRTKNVKFSSFAGDFCLKSLAALKRMLTALWSVKEASRFSGPETTSACPELTSPKLGNWNKVKTRHKFSEDEENYEREMKQRRIKSFMKTKPRCTTNSVTNSQPKTLLELDNQRRPQFLEPYDDDPCPDQALVLPNFSQTQILSCEY